MANKMADQYRTSSIDPLSEVNIKEVLSNILHEFLEVAFHMILYIREVYPPVLFERRRKYNIPVHMSVHPELNQYLKDVMCSIRPLLEEGDADKIVMVIHSKENEVLEKFVFFLQGLNEEELRKDKYLLQLERDLRAVLLKISVCDALLKPIPSDCTFSVLVHTNQRAAARMDHQQSVKEFSWVTADHAHHSDNSESSVLPLKSISTSVLQLQLCVLQTPRNSTEP